MELRGYHLHQVIKENFRKLMDFIGFRWFSLHMSRISSDLVKKAHTTFLGSLKVLSSRGIIGLIVATQHGCNTAATYDIWTPLNVLKGGGLGFPGDSWEKLNGSLVKCIKLWGSLGFLNFPRNNHSKENVSRRVVA